MESNTTTMPVIATCIASPRPMGAPSYVSAAAVAATRLHQGTAVSYAGTCVASTSFSARTVVARDAVVFAGLVGGGRAMGTDVDHLGTTTCDPPD